MIAISFKLYKKDEIENITYFMISDSMGIVSFSITCSLVGILVDFNIFGVVMLGLATDVGVMRDILLNKVPVLLTSELYESVAIVISIIVYLLDYFRLDGYLPLSIVFVFGLCFRIIAYYKRCHLPKLG